MLSHINDLTLYTYGSFLAKLQQLVLVTLTSNILQTDFMKQAENGSMYSDRIKDIVKTISMKNLLKTYVFFQ